MHDHVETVGPLRCSVIVTTWQRNTLLRGTLESLTHQVSNDFEVIVVCDGEDETVRALSREFAPKYSVRWVFHLENRGLPAARNTGAREAAEEVLLFLDDDIAAEPNLIASHLGHHVSADRRRRIAVCGRIAEDRQVPQQSHTDKSLQHSWERTLENYATLLAATGAESVGDEIERSVCFGLNCSIRRAVFLENGGFNEHFRASDEEMELGSRLYRIGVEFVFEPQAAITHRSTKDLTGYFRRCWGASGTLDTYRVFGLGQKNAQTRKLVSMYQGYLLDRVTRRCLWHASGALLSASKDLEKAANRTGSRILLTAWARACQSGEYWSNAKAAGCTPLRLRNMVGSPGSALVLHSLAEPKSREERSYYLAPGRFRRYMRWLRATGYKTASLDQWIAGDTRADHVLLTFDDGYHDLFDELFPLVIEFQYTPLVFLVADRVGGWNMWDQANGLRARRLLAVDQIREMQKYGVSFGSHTLTHPWLPDVSDAQLRREVSDSKGRLEDMLGVEVTSFAYPFGGVDRRVRAAVADAGYKLAFTTVPGLNLWNDPLCLNRAEVSDRDTISDFTMKVRTGYSGRQWLGKRIRVLERELPTQGLRATIGHLRGMGRRIFDTLSNE
jgi:peptidoglycan/xylan/chitin deacetylase (PgdA/CDA1 family)/GT2 family glycosyltransferase